MKQELSIHVYLLFHAFFHRNDLAIVFSNGGKDLCPGHRVSSTATMDGSFYGAAAYTSGTAQSTREALRERC